MQGQDYDGRRSISRPCKRVLQEFLYKRLNDSLSVTAVFSYRVRPPRAAETTLTSATTGELRDQEGLNPHPGSR